MVWLSIKHELRAMLEVGAGSTVNTSSIGRLIGVRNPAAYTASKHGVVGLPKAATPEVAGHGLAHQRGLPRPHLDADARPPPPPARAPDRIRR
jgi:NAD(P)-dependent dehydrogenase (short-subunit alcohol dehydrogenase family)